MTERPFRRAFRLALGGRRRLERELAEEVAFHLEARIERLVARGLSPEEARAEALRRFGSLDEARQHGRRWAARQARRRRVLEQMRSLGRDGRHTLRTLRRSPGFVALSVLTLGLGIGANAAMFGIVDRLLLSGPAQVADPGSLRRIYVTTRNDAGGVRTTGTHDYPLYPLLRDEVPALTGVAGYTSASPEHLGSGPAVRAVQVVDATSTLFRVLGTRPALGRFFLASEDVPPRGTSVAVLSYRLWMSEFGGDRGVLGHQISLDGDEYTVVGVAPRGFSGVERAPVDVWLPMSTCCRGNLPTWATTWNASRVRLVGRLRPTADVRLADTQMTAALRHGYSGHNPLMHEATVSARPLGYTDDGVEPREAGVSRVLYALSILMLLVAAANIANWLVVRAVRRRRELGIRRALGAGRARVARLLLTEALGLAVLGGIAGLLVGDWSGTLIGRALFPGIPWTSLPFDGRILACTAAAVLLTALLIGMLPPLRATRDDLRSCLSGGESVSRGRGRRVRTVLQAAQVALAVILLSTTGLFVRSLLRIRDLDLGVQVDRVVVAHIDLPEVEVHTPAERQRADVTAQTRFNALLDAVRRLPGVERASVEAGSVPFFQAVTVPIRPAGRSAMPAASGGGPYISAVSADYFRTVGTPTIRGRVFRSSEGYGTEPVAVVNETMARVVWPGENALGQCLVIQPRRAPRCVRVVGVAADAHQSGLRETPPMQVYVPFGQELPEESSALLVRPIGDAEAFVHTLRTALSRAAPDAHVWDVSLLGSSLQPQIRPWRVGTLVFGLFGIATLAIAGVGLFTVMAYLVAQQQHELGVRIALGARRRQILWMVWKRALVTSVVGTGVGVLGALAIAPVVQPLLFQGSARDPVLLTMVALVLALTAMAASMMPALRACRVDPVLVLRGE